MKTRGYSVIAADRYLTVDEAPVSVTVKRGDTLVARSDGAVRLSEGDRERVAYLPLGDVDIVDGHAHPGAATHESSVGGVSAARLLPSTLRYHCRWKGDATYYHVELNGERLENAAWGYPDAPESVSALRDKVAFNASLLLIDVATESVA